MSKERVKTERLELGRLVMDAGTQPRAGIDRDTVSEYAVMMEDGDVFPPLEVFTDGASYWLADGFHRVYAMKKLGYVEADARVQSGGLREAQLFSAAANTTHGLHRTWEDKRRAVELLLRDPEWAAWSDREIARMTKTSHTFVSKMREGISEAAEVTVRRTRQGTTFNTEGSARPERPPTEGKEPVPAPVPAAAPPPRVEYGDGSPLGQAAQFVVTYLSELSSREQVAPEQLEAALAWALATLEDGLDQEKAKAQGKEKAETNGKKAARPKRAKTESVAA